MKTILIFLFFNFSLIAYEDLPITKRNFYIGLVPNPANAPNSTFEDIINAYQETGKIADIGMVWVEKQGIGEFDLLIQNQVITGLRVYGLMPFITLNFAKIIETPNGLEYVIDAPEGINPSLADPQFREMWKNEAKNIANEFKPEYFSLGNEVNDYFYFHPEDLNDYLSLIDETYDIIKEFSPDTIVLVVLSYNHLIENNQWNLIEKFNPKVDSIGFTTYPYKNFSNPDDLPQNYYEIIKEYTDKPISFTEIGWSSSGSNNETSQAKFFLKFLDLTKELNIEMVNWLFLHETTLDGILGHISDPEIVTVALKKADDSEKEIYQYWIDVLELRKRILGKFKFLCSNP